jgi:hypothetical protein
VSQEVKIIPHPAAFSCLTATGLTAGGIIIVRIYTNSTQNTENRTYIIKRKKIARCSLCPVFASYILAFALQLRKKHRKTSVRVVKKCPYILVQ